MLAIGHHPEFIHSLGNEKPSPLEGPKHRKRWEENERVTDLLDSNCGLPALLLVQDGEADGPGWIHVGVEERWSEFACRESSP